MAGMVRDEWLSEVTRIPCYRVGEVVDDVLAALSALREDRAFLFAKVPVAQVDRARAFTRAGFYLVDTNVTLRHFGATRYGAPGADIVIEAATAADNAAVQRIASTAFRYSRFHLDPAFPRALADRVKAEWARNCCEGGRGSGVLVARRGGQVAGFLAVLTRVESAGTAAIIDLIAADPGAQGVGVGTALVRRFVNDWRDRATALRVGTQLANTESLALYRRSEFSVVEAQYVLHAHLKNGRPH